ncbi:hypothetical protein [Amycolatopsis anabasis]|uniref:hypothetical protein n=1 Tax=Amycolatopsis anabasis TaxID=1840409 RepID=UPI00131DB1FC|nr:hypothetical protein [Amycolatopsis anabasis]
MERVRTIEQAKALHKKYAGEDGDPKHISGARDVAEPTGAGSAGVQAEDKNGIDLDPEALAAAERKLGQHYFELAAYLEQAKRLEGHLQDGKSPVAKPMGHAFNIRAGVDEGGVQATLRAYLEELAALRESISQAGATHRTFDEDSAADLRPRESDR